MKQTASWAILSQLADQNRRILSGWRALLLLRKATGTLPVSERRWEHAPDRIDAIRPLLRQMERRGELRPLSGLSGLYEVTVPYARTGLIQEDEILMEIHPYAAISHRSALVFHNLTDDLPTGITAIMPSDGRAGLLPPGTDLADWESGVFIVGKTISEILGQPIHWTRVMPTRYFGLHEYTPRGYPVRVTTPERTLVDGLQKPELCGGIAPVLRAWARGRDLLDVKSLVDYTERLEITVIKQRVGFLLEELGFTHPSLDIWRKAMHRGGSSKLFGSVSYASTFSERWSLSINVPLDEFQSNH